MNKEMLLNIIGMTEDKVIEKASKLNMDDIEEYTFIKGKDFIDKYNELDNKNARDKVILKLIAYGLI